MKINTDWWWRSILLRTKQKGVTWGGNLATHEHTCLLGEQNSLMLVCARQQGLRCWFQLWLFHSANISWRWSFKELMGLWEGLSSRQSNVRLLRQVMSFPEPPQRQSHRLGIQAEASSCKDLQVTLGPPLLCCGFPTKSDSIGKS